MICAREACLRPSFNEERLERERKSAKSNHSNEGFRPSNLSPWLVEGGFSALRLLRRMPTLGFQSRFLRSPGRLGGTTFFRNDERPSDQIGKSFFCQLAISGLAAHVARDDAYAAIARHA